MKIDDKYVCEYCKQDYEYTLLKNGKPNVIFCSQECCDKYNNNEKNKRFARCKNCGKEYQTLRYMSGKYNRSLFCCKACESKYNTKVNSTRIAICRNCGKTFEQQRLDSGKFSKTEFCCNQCATNYRQDVPYGFDRCIVCNTIFKEDIIKSKLDVKYIKYQQNKFCSEKCKNIYYKQKYNKIRTKECKQCGKTFILSNTYNDKRIFCSEECIKVYEREKSITNNIRNCEYCGKTFRPYITDSGRVSKSKFCSDDCWLSYWQQINTEKHGVPYTFMLNNKHIVVSKTNESFARLLKENNIVFTYEYKLKDNDSNNYSYDFYLSEYNLLVEINPTFTHSAVENVLGWTAKTQNYHYNKTKVANDNGYQCICIWDWDNKENIIKAIKNNTLKIEKQQDIKKHWNILNTKQHQLSTNQDEKQMISEGWLPVWDDGQILMY